MEERLVQSMGLIRMLSGVMEITAALWILRLGRLEDAVRINAALGLVGPTILVLVTIIGVVGLATRLPIGRTVLLVAGVLLVFASTR